MKREPEVYDFSAQPRVAGVKPKYREERLDMTNLMNDPRVVRGNTYAAVTSSKSEFKKQQPKLRKDSKKQTKQQTKSKFEFDAGFEPTTPRAIDGRQHFSAQTDAFVQTLRDKPIEYEKQCQTDFYLDRPVQRLFKPTKTGVDISTQIEANDPDLFDFDYQVEPILDALLSKILDTSRYELFQEEQFQETEKKRIDYERTRNVTLAQTQKLQENESRMRDEQERRQLQFKKVKQQNAYTQKKLIGRVLSKQYMKNLHRNTMMILEEQQFFRQPLEFDLYDNYLPWLYDEIQSNIKEQVEMDTETAKVIGQFEQDYIKKHESLMKKEQARRQKIAEERQKQKERKEHEKEEKKRRKREEEERKRQEAEQAMNTSQPADVPPAT